jgi:hypothetical protein
MAIRGRVAYDDAADGRGRKAPDDFMATGTFAKPKRRKARALSPDEERKYRNIYWLGLNQTGVSTRAIERQSGYDHSTVAEGVKWAAEHGEAWLRSQIQEGRSAG